MSDQEEFVTLSIRLPRDEHDALVAASRRERRSVSGQAGVFIADGLTARGYLESAEQRRETDRRAELARG